MPQFARYIGIDYSGAETPESAIVPDSILCVVYCPLRQ